MPRRKGGSQGIVEMMEKRDVCTELSAMMMASSSQNKPRRRIEAARSYRTVKKCVHCFELLITNHIPLDFSYDLSGSWI